MSNTRWVKHQGRVILYVDYQGQRTAGEMLRTLDEAMAIITAMPDKVLLLCNFEGSYASVEYMTRVKEVGKEILNDKTQKMALLGITGMKIVLVKGYLAFTGNQSTRAFATEAEALAWLVE